MKKANRRQKEVTEMCNKSAVYLLFLTQKLNKRNRKYNLY